MNKKILKRLICMTIASLLMASCAALFACDEEEGDEWKQDTYLMLVNKTNTVGEDYTPEGLVKLDSSYTNGGKAVELESKTAEAAIKMLDAMKRDGINNVTVTSGYRTYKYQKTLFDNYCVSEKLAHPTWSDDEVKEYVLTYSAFPGTSEHQTGMCMDLITTEMVGLWNYGEETPDNPYDKGFAETAAFEWLQDHAHEYGFILRFPEDKTSLTGYSYESWHYRYVGVEHAEKIHEAGICLEEYLGGDGK